MMLFFSIQFHGSQYTDLLSLVFAWLLPNLGDFNPSKMFVELSARGSTATDVTRTNSLVRYFYGAFVLIVFYHIIVAYTIVSVPLS